MIELSNINIVHHVRQFVTIFPIFIISWNEKNDTFFDKISEIYTTF